jgi:hypothetical protein
MALTAAGHRPQSRDSAGGKDTLKAGRKISMISLSQQFGAFRVDPADSRRLQFAVLLTPQTPVLSPLLEAR